MAQDRRNRSVQMNRKELKRKIEHTREVLDTAIEKKYCSVEVLDISRMLDRLIEEYVTENQQGCVLVQKSPGTVKI